MKRLMIVLVGLVTLGFALNVFGAEKTATGFYYPTKTDQLGNYAGWLGNECNPHKEPYGGYIGWNGSYHIGKDIAGNFGDPIYSIADGIVLEVEDSSSWGGGQARGLFIKHRLISGEEFVALHGHVATWLKKGDRVVAGQQIATIAITTNPHDHFGVARRALKPVPPWGRADCQQWPNDPNLTPNGFVDPIAFIQSNIPLNVLSHPAGTLAQPVAEHDLLEARKVYFLQNVGGKIVKRWVKTEQALISNHLSFAEVIAISQEEKACYPKGADITGFEQITQFANGLHEGQLIYLQEPSPSGTWAYMVSGGKVHHVKMTGDDFLFGGWKFANVSVKPGPYAIGNDITFQDLTTCSNDLSLAAGLGAWFTPVQGKADPRFYDEDPWVQFFGKNVIVASHYDLRSFRVEDKALLWENKDAFGNMEMSDGLIYAFGCEQENQNGVLTDVYYKVLRRIDPLTGQTLSTTLLGNRMFGCNNNDGFFVIEEDAIFVLTYGMLYVFNKHTGAELWTYAPPRLTEYDQYSFRGAIAKTSKGRIVLSVGLRYSNIGPTVVLLDPATQKEACRFSSGRSALWYASPVAGPNGVLYYGEREQGGYGSYVFALDEATCKPIWEHYLIGEQMLKAAGPYGVYVKSGERLVSLNPSSGALGWITSLGDPVASPKVRDWKEVGATPDGNVYVLTTDLLILDARTGQEMNRYVLDIDPSPSLSNLAIDKEAIAFIAGKNGEGELRVFKAPNLPPVAKLLAPSHVKGGDEATLDASSSYDLDGDALSFRIFQDPNDSFLVSLTGATTSRAMFIAPLVTAPALLTLCVSVSDGKEGTDDECVALTILPPDVLPRSLPNGALTPSWEACQSGYDGVGPDQKKYCISRDMSCGFPGTDGVRQNETAWYNGTEYRCIVGNVYVLASLPAPRSVPEGGLCRLGQNPSDCSSDCCWRFVDGNGYCINERKVCALPGTGGLSFTQTTCFQGILYECRFDPQNLTPIGTCP